MDYSENVIIWPGSSSFSPGKTPFGYFDSDAVFQDHCGSGTLTGFISKSTSPELITDFQKISPPSIFMFFQNTLYQ